MSAPPRDGARDLHVAELFGPTVQGEGPSTGQRAVFVRLSRCNLSCPGCDTPYTWDTRRFDLRAESRRIAGEDVAAWALGFDVPLVVVTGGEPLLQQEALGPVLQRLTERERRVEVETNGTRIPTVATVDLVTRFNVSPKLRRFGAGMSPETRIRPDVLRAFQRCGKAVFKFVISRLDELDEVAALVEYHGLTDVWVMPEGTDAATVSSGLAELAGPALARGFNLSGRLHVLIWGDQRGH